MNIYLINKETMKCVGRFSEMAAAEEVGEACKFDWDVVADADDLSSRRFTVQKLVEMHNANTKKAEHVETFKNKAAAQEAVWAVLEALEDPKVPKTQKRKAGGEGKKGAPKAEGYAGHRSGSLREELHKWFDEERPEREEFLQRCLDRGLSAATARNRFRQFNKALKDAAA